MTILIISFEQGQTQRKNVFFVKDREISTIDLQELIVLPTHNLILVFAFPLFLIRKAIFANGF